MSDGKIGDPTLHAEDRAAFRAFWEVYNANYDQITAASRRDLAAHPEFGPLLRNSTPEQFAEQNQRSRDILRRALLDGEWQTYLEELRTQGASYAHGAISFSGWFEVVSSFRTQLVRYLFSTYQGEPDLLMLALNGMNRFLEIVMAHLGEAYLQTKQDQISSQQKAIRELSTPV